MTSAVFISDDLVICPLDGAENPTPCVRSCPRNMFVQLRNRKVAKMIVIKLGIVPLPFQDLQCEYICECDVTKGGPFLKCVASIIWVLPERRCKGLLGWYGALVSHVCPGV